MWFIPYIGSRMGVFGRMSMNNKQRWMGGVVLLGGGVLLTALLLKGKEEIHLNQKQSQVAESQVTQNSVPGEMVQLHELTVDVETEKRLLEDQKRSREKAVAEQEARAAEFLATQQQAEAEAARKAAEEYAAINARRTGVQSSDNIPPELVEDEKAKQKRLAEEKLAAQKKLDQQKATQQKAEQEKSDAEKKKQADLVRQVEEKKKAETEAKKKAEASAKQKESEKLKATEKLQAEDKSKAEAKKKIEADKARELLEHGDKQWMVQVALAVNEANADAVSAKLRAKGYKVTKSPTSKGIRIMVGPSKDRETADSTRKKIAADASLGMKSAWVIDWVPLDRR